MRSFIKIADQSCEVNLNYAAIINSVLIGVHNLELNCIVNRNHSTTQWWIVVTVAVQNYGKTNHPLIYFHPRSMGKKH